MKYIFIGLISMLVLFLYSACRVSSKCSRLEEQRSLKNKKGE